jgi:hypothetical protein
MKILKYITILAVAIIFFDSCTKQVAGPAGPTGANGAQGAAAAYSVTIDSVMPPSWVSTGTTFNFTIPVASMTSPNNSIVEVYYATSYNELSTWYELPISNALIATDNFDFLFYLYNVTILYTYSSAPTQQLYFKVVVINQPEGKIKKHLQYCKCFSF